MCAPVFDYSMTKKITKCLIIARTHHGGLEMEPLFCLSPSVCLSLFSVSVLHFRSYSADMGLPRSDLFIFVCVCAQHHRRRSEQLCMFPCFFFAVGSVIKETVRDVKKCLAVTDRALWLICCWLLKYYYYNAVCLQVH